MKTLHKLQIGVLVLAMLILNTISCTKENPPAPASNTSASAGLALDELNRKTGNKPKPPKLSANYGLVTTFVKGADFDFFNPDGITIDKAGNLYTSDVLPSRIRKITPAAIMTILAGNGAPGYQDGTGLAASFFYPRGLAVGIDGNIYVADGDKFWFIRKITPTGVVTTFIRNVDVPTGVVADCVGNLYVTEDYLPKVVKIDKAGKVTLLAGGNPDGNANGTGAAASFNNPAFIVLDRKGNLYVADFGNHLIRKITPAGVVTTFAGNGTQGSVNGPALSASFNYPRGLAFDSRGNLYVSDQIGNQIRKITPEGLVSTLAGSGATGSANGIGTAASFDYPSGLVCDKEDNLYVVDYNSIRKIITK